MTLSNFNKIGQTKWILITWCERCGLSGSSSGSLWRVRWCNTTVLLMRHATLGRHLTVVVVRFMAIGCREQTAATVAVAVVVVTDDVTVLMKHRVIQVGDAHRYVTD